MSEVRLYVDEDAAEHAVVQGLRARGIDVLTTIEANRCETDDEDQLTFASAQGRAIYTFNALTLRSFTGNICNKGTATAESS
jgi:hypothetical protein